MTIDSKRQYLTRPNGSRELNRIHIISAILQWVNEWLLFIVNSAIFQLYHGENKLIFNEMMMKSALF